MTEQKDDQFDFSRYSLGRFQPIPGYEDYARTPRVVLTQTNSLLELFRGNGLRKFDLFRGYLHDYTLPFLHQAEQGVERVFSKDQQVIDAQSLELNEAADTVYVVFAWMHHFAKSPFLPMGFSRKGILQAPGNRETYIGRVKEVIQELGLIVSGLRNPAVTLELRDHSLRTHTFFKVGGNLPLHLPDQGDAEARAEEMRRKKLERDKTQFNNLLGDLEIDLN